MQGKPGKRVLDSSQLPDNPPNPNRILWVCTCSNRETGPLSEDCPKCGAVGNRHPIQYGIGEDYEV